MEPFCPLLVPLENHYPIRSYGIKDALASGYAVAKIEAMKRAITILVNGDGVVFRDLSVVIVRYALPVEDRALQRLLLLYLEIVSEDWDVFGRVPPDRTAVCDHLRRKLEHRNEFVRCDTLRFLSRMRDPCLAEPLVPSVLANLDHPHAFVRRDAFAAVYAFCRLRKPDGGKLLRCAADIVEPALGWEQDAAALRNAFVTLFAYWQDRAAEYVLANADRVVSEWPGILQIFAVYTAIRYRFDTRCINIVMSLLSNPASSSAAVYECADALLWISPDEPTVVRAAANAYCKLLSSSSSLQKKDNDVILIVQDRLHQLCISHTDAMVDLVIDTIATPSHPSRSPNVYAKRTLEIMRTMLYLTDMLAKTSQAGEQLQEIGALGALLKQVFRTCAEAFHACAKEHPDLVAPILMETLEHSAHDHDLFGGREQLEGV